MGKKSSKAKAATANVAEEKKETENETTTKTQQTTTKSVPPSNEVVCDNAKENKKVEQKTSFQFDDDDDDDDVKGKQKMVLYDIPSLPLIPFAQGRNAKASILHLHSWVGLALTLDGRDKLTKVVQYVSRMLAWWLAGSNHAKRFAALKASVTNSRKAFRLGRSLIEIHRLKTMGLWETFLWHLARQDGDDSSDFRPPNPKTMDRRASSNIGWGPVTVQEDAQLSHQYRGLYRSLSNVAYRAMFRPMYSRLYSGLSNTSSSSSGPDTPMWKLMGNALKMVGLCGFWAADNVSFLCGSGMMDDYTKETKGRMKQRKKIIETCSVVANRSYFMGAVAGFMTNLRIFLDYRTKLTTLRQDVIDAIEDNHDDERDFAEKKLDQAKKIQFGNFVALLKSCCDILVFSNNPGLDLWQKHYGQKMHEGFHCLCGLVSASTVLYNNFPNAPVLK